VIAELVGVPPPDRPIVEEYANSRVGRDDPEYVRDDADFTRINDAMFAYAAGLCAERRSCPGEDLVTTLLNSEVEGRHLLDQELKLFIGILVAAGSETTRNVLTAGLNALIEYDQYRQLVEEPSMVPAAVEEFLRWSPPLAFSRRNLVEDVELRGQSLEAGAKVSLWYVSANRDEEVFDNPFTFDIRRTPNEHLSFASGTHYCLGASLARLELRLFFEALVRRVPVVRRLEQPVFLRANQTLGIKRLVVDLTSGQRAMSVS
jgi:cholest-4-en-3-one 26-monooxygenase